MTAIVNEKVQKIEAFINEKLKKDLKLTLEAGDKIYAEISEYLELQNLLEKFSEMEVRNINLQSMVDVGCNFYAKANIPSLEKIYVDIGLGFHLEMTHAEAIAFIKERTDLLNDRAEVFRQKSFEIKSRIKVCLEGLREIQSMNVNERPSYRDVFS